MQTGPMLAAAVSIAKLGDASAMAVALLLFGIGVVGQVIGAVGVGALNDLMAPALGTGAIRYSMLLAAVCVTLGGGVYFLSARHLEADTHASWSPEGRGLYFRRFSRAGAASRWKRAAARDNCSWTLSAISGV